MSYFSRFRGGRFGLGGWRRPFGYGGWRQGFGYRPGWGAGWRGGYRFGGLYHRRWPGYSHFRHFGFGRFRRYWPQYGGFGAPGFGLAPQADASQWIRWAQACLAMAVGPWVLQDGVMGPNTRKAILIFQAKQGLPGTGFLDAATVNALQAACAGPQAAPDQGAPAAMAAPPGGDDAAAAAAAAAAGGGAPPDAGVQPPDAGAPGAAPPDGGGAPPGDAQAGELFLGMRRRGRWGRRGFGGGWRRGWRGRRRWWQQQPDGDDDDQDQEGY